MFEGVGTADPVGYCMFIDGEMYPVYGKTLINGYKLASGEASGKDVVIHIPQEIEIAYRDPNDNELKLLDTTNVDCKSFKLIDANDYYWWWMHHFWYYIFHQGEGHMLSPEKAWDSIRNNLNAEHDISFITMWARRRPHRDLLWKKILPIINEHCRYHAGENLDVYKIVKWYSERELCPEFYPRVLIDFVTETDENTVFLTEKTWRPVIYGKIPLVYAAPNTYKRMTDYGYTLHPEIDYSFDSVVDNEERGELIIKQLDNLIHNYSVSELSEITRDIRMKNFDWVVDLTKRVGPPPDCNPRPNMVETIFWWCDYINSIDIPEDLILAR